MTARIPIAASNTAAEVSRVVRDVAHGTAPPVPTNVAVTLALGSGSAVDLLRHEAMALGHALLEHAAWITAPLGEAVCAPDVVGPSSARWTRGVPAVAGWYAWRSDATLAHRPPSIMRVTTDGRVLWYEFGARSEGSDLGDGAGLGGRWARMPDAPEDDDDC